MHGVPRFRIGELASLPDDSIRIPYLPVGITTACLVGSLLAVLGSSSGARTGALTIPGRHRHRARIRSAERCSVETEMW
jgi:hypothetical protein